MKPLAHLTAALLVLSALTSCEPNTTSTTCGDGIQNGDETGIDCGGSCPPCQVIDFDGKAQKGPFLNGSSVQLAALDTTFSPTGSTFNTQILDNTGSYTFSGINLPSSYATLRVDGFYFNEVCGKPSDAQITLNSIVDLNNVGLSNVNTLTHLEKARIEYLMSQGLPFAAAKTIALPELLNVFSIDSTLSMPNAELLDLSSSTEADAVLIAITSILQGYRSESEFSDLMANIITDLRTDGVLNSTSLASSLMAHALALDTNTIRQNLVDRYDQMGIAVTVPNFGKYISNYVLNSPHAATELIVDLPDQGNFGTNILNLTDTLYDDRTPYSFSAQLPNDCISLKVVVSQTFGACNGCWFYSVGSNNGWSIGNYDLDNDVQEFIQTGSSSDLDIRFEPGTYKVEYFINGSSIPAYTKEFQAS